MTRTNACRIIIDNKQITGRENQTILQVANENQISIPSLCAFRHLPSFGACRLCIVEVDEIRGFPTACTTPIQNGMNIRTNTSELRKLRQEMLKLLLSEHPASCLFCEEKTECDEYQGTIRKVGMTTGCQYCSSNGKCELQSVTEEIGLSDSSYPVYYRGFQVERDDPFYDRDYNLCILCGRCVRVCNDIRLNETLMFKQRGQQTTIGPAYDQSHLDAGCEFCGACVATCPTGALAVKAGKWKGSADKETAVVCGFCSIGCTLLLQSKQDQIIDSLPDYDSPIDQGLICLKGRFATTEIINSPRRLTQPMIKSAFGYKPISWKQALLLITKKISQSKPEKVSLFVSTDLMNEDYFVIQQFARDVIGTEQIFSSIMSDLEDALIPFLNLVCQPMTLEKVASSDLIIMIDFDSRYAFSLIGNHLKKRIQQGIPLINIHTEVSNFTILSEISLRCKIPEIPKLVSGIMRGISGASDRTSVKTTKTMTKIINMIRNASDPIIITGQNLINHPDKQTIYSNLLKARDENDIHVLVCHPYTNLMGMMIMGVFPGLKPGEILKPPESQKHRITIKNAGIKGQSFEKQDIVYLIGERISDNLPPGKFTIYQGIIQPSGSMEPDIMLPSAVFPECQGSFYNYQGIYRKTDQAVPNLAESKPDWWIVSELIRKLKQGRKPNYNHAYIHREIKKLIRNFADITHPMDCLPIQIKPAGKATSKKPKNPVKKKNYSYLMYWQNDQEIYKGIPLADEVLGMRQLMNRNIVVMNPADADDLKIDETVEVIGDEGADSFVAPVKTSSQIPRGSIRYRTTRRRLFSNNPCQVNIRRSDE